MSGTTIALLLLAGCGASAGPIGLLATDPEVVGTKLLAPGIEGHSCRSAVLGVPLRAGSPAVAEAVAEILARDPEGNLVTHAEIRTRSLITGVYNRRCIDVRGNLARAISTLTLPGHPHH